MVDGELKIIADQLINRSDLRFRMPLQTWVPAPVHRRRPIVGLIRAMCNDRMISVNAGVGACRFYGLFPCAPRRHLLGVWQRCMRDCVTGALISPKRVYSIFHADIPVSVALRFRQRSGDKIDYYNIISSPVLSIITRRTIDFTTSDALHHLINTEAVSGRQAAGLGIGMRLIRNALVLYQLLGIRRIRLHAGLSSGGAVWPKLGFKPTSEAEWLRIHAHIRARVQELPEPMRTSVSRRIGALLSKSDPALIFAVSGLPDDLPPPIDRRLGDYLLGGSAWDGELDLRDELAREQFAGYFRRRNLDSVESLVAHWRSTPP
jgi:hypothetical protein